MFIVNIDIKDNITIDAADNSNEVVAVISEKEIILKDGYEALYDVGLDE